MFALVLSPFVSHPMSPFVFPFCWLACPPSRYLVSTFPPLSRPHMCACVGWCICSLDVLSLPCLRMFPIVFPHVCLCWMVRPPSWRLVSHCLPTCVPVLDGVSAFPRSRLPFSPHSVPLSALSRIVSPHICLCWMVGLPSRRVVFPFCLRLSLHMCACDGMSAFSGLSLVCHCLPLSPHMCLCWMVCLPSRGLVSACLRLSPHNMRLCWMVCPPFQGLVSPGPPLLPILSHCLPACVHLCWMVRPPSRRLVSELSPIVPTCVPVLDGVSAFPKSCLPLSPFLSILVSGCLHVFPIVSHCLPLPPIVSDCLPTCACVGWSTFPKSWFSLPPVVSLDMCDLCCMVRPLSRGLVSPCLPLSPFLFPCVGWCVHLPDVLSPLSPLSPSLSSFLSPSLSPNLSFFLFPFVVGGLISHFIQTVYCWGRLS